MVYFKDKDLRWSLQFMITAATIIEQMLLDICKNPSHSIDYDSYQEKIEKYKVTLELIKESFEVDVFGELYNRRPRATFIDKLMQNGWKYFCVKNLNELFAMIC